MEFSENFGKFCYNVIFLAEWMKINRWTGTISFTDLGFWIFFLGVDLNETEGDC